MEKVGSRESGEQAEVNVTARVLRKAMERVLFGGCTQADSELMKALLEGRVIIHGRIAIPCSDGFILGSRANA
jgi:hypothetical protein